jgi:hypothetical protein
MVFRTALRGPALCNVLLRGSSLGAAAFPCGARGLMQMIRAEAGRQPRRKFDAYRDQLLNASPQARDGVCVGNAGLKSEGPSERAPLLRLPTPEDLSSMTISPESRSTAVRSAPRQSAKEVRKEADSPACIAWNQRMLGYGRPAQPSSALVTR